MVVFYVISNENTFPIGRELKQMYRGVPITKRGNKTFLFTAGDYISQPIV